jgi:transcriptional regulator with XRE-family HTH domain
MKTKAAAAHADRDVAPGLAGRVRQLRKQHGWSQSELAERLGFHLTYVNRVETGKQVPALEFVVKAARLFGVSVDQLLADDTEALADIRIEDKGLAERLRLLETLEEHEREALLTVIDSMLTKHRIRQFLQEGAPAGAAG